jgi:predicted phosphodiesterase
MAFHGKVEWPSKAEILAQAKQVATKVDLARELGVSRPSLHDYVRRQGWTKELDQALGKGSSRLDNLDGKPPSEEEILRQRVKELEAAAKKQRKLDIQDAQVVERFEGALQNVKPKFKPKARSRVKQPGKDHEHILLLSDLHASEVVVEEETLGLNSYNWDIMLERLNRLQQAVLSFQENRPYPIRKLRVMMLGDMTSGRIHDDLAETNEFGHEQSVVQLGYDLSGWLEEFVPHYETIDIAGVVGNHPRPHRKPRAKRAADNSDWTLYKFIQAYHRNNPAFTWNFPQAKMADFLIAERWRCLLMHGDGIRTTMIDVPFGGIIRYSQKLESQFAKAGKPLDIICAGHWHTQNAIEGIGTKLYINGSVKGPDEYTLQRFGAARPAGQLLLTATPKRGITDISYLDCVDHIPNSEASSKRA